MNDRTQPDPPAAPAAARPDGVAPEAPAGPDGGRPEPLGRRAARLHRNREALIAAARTVFARDGFAEAKIADIAREAGLAYGSFYTHVASKEALFREVILRLHQDGLADARSVAAAAEGGSLRAQITAENRRYIESYRRDGRLFWALEQMIADDRELDALYRSARARFVRRATRAITTWQEAGLADAAVDAEVTAVLLTGMVERYAQMAHLGAVDTADDERALRSIEEVWVRTLGLKDGPASRPARGAPAARRSRTPRRTATS